MNCAHTKRPLGLLTAFYLAFQVACGGGTSATKRVQPQQATADAAAVAAQQSEVTEPNGPFLWEVKGPKGPVFLYGTIHTGGSDLVPAVAFERLTAATTFVMEMDIDSVSPTEMMKQGMLEAGQSLEVLLGPELWSKLLSGINGALPAAVLSRFKPWLAAIMLIQVAVGKQAEPTDKVLLDRAKQAGLQLKYLETAQEQMDLLQQSLDLDNLKETLAHVDELGATMKQLVDAYRAGDAAALERITLDSVRTTPAAHALMFTQRNENWLPEIQAFAAAGNVFVAVGAAHLIGADGIVQMLRDRGHTVTRVAAR